VRLQNLLRDLLDYSQSRNIHLVRVRVQTGIVVDPPLPTVHQQIVSLLHQRKLLRFLPAIQVRMQPARMLHVRSMNLFLGGPTGNPE
jgi:hypothetical protein